MKMRQIYLFVTVLLLPFWLSAQTKVNHERFLEIKEAFLQEDLKITEEEGKMFWPVFRRYEQEKHQLRKSYWGGEGKDRLKPADMNEAEANAFIEKQMEFERKLSEIDLRYLTEFRKILPPQKVAKLLSFDQRFKRYLYRQAQEKRGAK